MSWQRKIIRTAVVFIAQTVATRLAYRMLKEAPPRKRDRVR